MRRVGIRHREVLAELAAFVERGHALTFVHGNHDIELHWDSVREELVSLLARLAEERAARDGRAFDRDAFLARIDFQPWFFYADGVAYIEHGHQYDAFCATEYVMAPLSPLDPRRIARGFSEVFLRYVVHATRGLKEHGHDGRGMFHYVSFGVGLGARGLFNLAKSFTGAVLELFRLRRAHFTDAAARLREEHEKRMGLLAEATRIGVDRLRALMALQVPPVTKSIRGILASVLLDRLALALAATIALLGVAVASWNHGNRWWAAGIVLVAWAFTNRWLAKQRKIDPDDSLLERASHLAKLFPAAFVVMGHTHVPMRVPVDGGATYINVGSWDEEEEETEPRAARTHLVIRADESGPVAELLAWDSNEQGPRLFASTSLAKPGGAEGRGRGLAPITAAGRGRRWGSFADGRERDVVARARHRDVERAPRRGRLGILGEARVGNDDVVELEPLHLVDGRDRVPRGRKRPSKTRRAGRSRARSASASARAMRGARQTTPTDAVQSRRSSASSPRASQSTRARASSNTCALASARAPERNRASDRGDVRRAAVADVERHEVVRRDAEGAHRVVPASEGRGLVGSLVRVAGNDERAAGLQRAPHELELDRRELLRLVEQDRVVDGAHRGAPIEAPGAERVNRGEHRVVLDVNRPRGAARRPLVERATIDRDEPLAVRHVRPLLLGGRRELHARAIQRVRRRCARRARRRARPARAARDPRRGARDRPASRATARAAPGRRGRRRDARAGATRSLGSQSAAPGDASARRRSAARRRSRAGSIGMRAARGRAPSNRR